jgi:uncharacterized pyridoxal phosphate-containing UPF0001 family protein
MPSLGTFPHVVEKWLMAIHLLPAIRTGLSLLRRRRELALRLLGQPISTISLKERSMGKSNDYHVAVEVGATMVRVDKAFGGARRA